MDMTNNITSRDIRSEAPSPRAFEAPNEPLRISPRLHGSILTSGSPTTRLRPVGPKMVVAEIKDFQGGEALESGRQSLAAKFFVPERSALHLDGPSWRQCAMLKKFSAPAWPGDLDKTELYSVQHNADNQTQLRNVHLPRPEHPLNGYY